MNECFWNIVEDLNLISSSNRICSLCLQLRWWRYLPPANGSSLNVFSCVTLFLRFHNNNIMQQRPWSDTHILWLLLWFSGGGVIYVIAVLQPKGMWTTEHTKRITLHSHFCLSPPSLSPFMPYLHISFSLAPCFFLNAWGGNWAGYACSVTGESIEGALLLICHGHVTPAWKRSTTHTHPKKTERYNKAKM